MPTIAIILLFISSILFLSTSIGIYRCKNTLQVLHFCTIIDITCLPLSLVAILFALGFHNTRIFIPILIIFILSPISSYFIGKFYNEKHKIH